MSTTRLAALPAAAVLAIMLSGCVQTSAQPSTSAPASVEDSVDASASAGTGGEACVEFTDLALGSQIGTPSGLASGDLAFTENGIPVQVIHFEWTSGAGTLGYAEVTGATPEFGDGQFVFMNNINFRFDFTGVGFAVTSVDLRYRDQGGFENLAVNDDPTLPIADEITSMPTPLGGATVTSSTGADGVGGAEFVARIDSLTIGGQEFSLDRVCAHG